MIRFHLDECVDHDVAAGMRAIGIDVTNTTEAGLRTSADESQLGYATQTGRVLVTHDTDFLAIAGSSRNHAGIVYAQSGRVTLGELIRYCDHLRFEMSSEDMAGRLVYVPCTRRRR